MQWHVVHLNISILLCVYIKIGQHPRDDLTLTKIISTRMKLFHQVAIGFI